VEIENSVVQCGVIPLTLEEATIAITKRAKQLVGQLIEERGDDKPPFLPIEYARLLDIKRIIKADFKNTSAILLRLHDGCIIKVNKNQHPYRQNFSCLHEMGHILFDELGLIDYVRKIEYRTFNPTREQETRARARERLCDVAATELLMPKAIFRKYLLGFGVSVNSIALLSNIFKASIPTVAIRIEEVSSEPCVAFQWQLWRRRGSKMLRLSWSQRKERCTPVNKQAKLGSSIFKAFETDSIVKCHKLFKIGADVKRLPMESKGFGYGENRRVYSLAFLDR
jgi:Zn-dependent peptidase ImmA (M78 family)